MPQVTDPWASVQLNITKTGTNRTSLVLQWLRIGLPHNQQPRKPALCSFLLALLPTSSKVTLSQLLKE